MPKRSNEFQKLVYYFKKHTINNVDITESRELLDKQTGVKREVDIVVETNVGGNQVIISIECIDRSRKADMAWIEQMYEKHRKLPTNVLILISKLGFTKKAIEYADKNNINLSNFDEITAVSPEETLLKFNSLFIRLNEINIESVRVSIVNKTGKKLNLFVMPDTKVLIYNRNIEITMANVAARIVNNKAIVEYFLTKGDEKNQYYQS